MAVPPAPNATEEESVPVNISVLLTVSVLPSTITSVAPDAGAVKATLLMLVAVATPRTGVTSVGLVALTPLPEPVVVIAVQPPAPSSVRTWPEVPAGMQPVPEPTGVPRVQSCRQYCVVPVVPFGANPCLDVETLFVVISVVNRPPSGSPVAFVNTTADGVPRFGVVIAQEMARHTLPVPLGAMNVSVI